MPSLESRLREPQLENNRTTDPALSNKQQSSTFSDSLQPGLSPFMRCPLPPVGGVSPDALRQWYRGGVMPQKRLLYSRQ